MGKPLPLCTRCLFIYSGLIPGFFIGIFTNGWFLANGLLSILVLLALSIPCALDWWLQEHKGRESTNFRRAFTGSLIGIAGGISLSFFLT